jgi:hypothetical protein
MADAHDKRREPPTRLQMTEGMAEELHDGDARADYASRDELPCGASIRQASALSALDNRAL